MGLPGHRRTSSHKRRRAAHFALKPVATTTCEKCKAAILPHRACKACGWYKGREAVGTASRRLARLTKKTAVPVAPAAQEPAAKAKAETAAPAAKKAAAGKKATKTAAPRSNMKKTGSGDK